MPKLPQYFVGYIPEVKTVCAIRADAQQNVSRDLQELIGGSARDLNFNVFANIQFMSRKGNDFGRAFWLYVNQQPIQIKADSAEYQHIYALLSLVCADLIGSNLKLNHWTRVSAHPLAKNEDIANMLRLSGLIS